MFSVLLDELKDDLPFETGIAADDETEIKRNNLQLD
jgi:hypothetical protein